jgi:hypothetical protein
MEHDFGTTHVAFYLADGTTARKALMIPEEVADEVFVYEYVSKSTYIEVDSLDIITSSNAALYIIASQVVAFTIV